MARRPSKKKVLNVFDPGFPTQQVIQEQGKIPQDDPNEGK
jgi:hypothetical protein